LELTYAKQKNVAKARKPVDGAGDTWTWTGLDADSKLIVSWLVGTRDAGSAYTFVSDLADRLANRIQLTSDGLKLYLGAVEDAFAGNIDYSMLVKLYGASGENETRYSPAKCLGCISQPITGDPDPRHISTSYVERQNLTMRMSMRRFTRLTNAFSKKLANHVHMVAIYTVWYNWTRLHKTLRTTPAMAAGLTERVWDMAEIVALIDAAEKPAQSN
jgi:IS1 family transposase